jgi:hypothetical protein
MKPLLRPTLAWLGALWIALVPAGSAGRDEGADGHFNHRRSSHFILYQDVDIDRYSGPRGSRQFERDVLEVLENAFDSASQTLGVRPVRPIDVVVYDSEIFDTQFSSLFGFRAAGFYHGVIRIRGGERVSTDLIRTLHHEYVHAAMDAAAPNVRLPAWLNEGLAEWFEGLAVGKRYLSKGEALHLAAAKRSGELPAIASLNGSSFSQMGPERARLAYLKSYAFIEYLVRKYGQPSLRRFVAGVMRTGNVDRSSERAYRRNPQQLEADFDKELT